MGSKHQNNRASSYPGGDVEEDWDLASDAGGILHVRGGPDADGEFTRVVHITELLADRLKDMRDSSVPSS